MPTYEYKCPKCGEFEVTQRITENALKKCPTCKSKVERLLSRTSFILKGTGWYVTDYAKKPSGDASKADAPKADSAKSDSSGSESSGSDSSKSDASSKSEASSKGNGKGDTASSSTPASSSKSSSEKGTASKAAD
jgi:putative FmdB family regulatory protein